MVKLRKTAIALILAGSFLVGSVQNAGAAKCPRLYKFSAYKGSPGKLIKISGKDFGNEEGQVKFGDTNAEVKKWSKKKIYVYVPEVELGNTYRVRVCKDVGACTKSMKFFVTYPGPQLYRIKNISNKNDYYKGSVGDKLEIKGINFNKRNISVKFGSESAKIIKRSNKTIRVAVPNVAKDKTYSVFVTDGENNSNAQDFYVKP
ncbi:MAG: IPT/TIG domain-containing protein [Parcubacteria group bacterium]|jgi:hypothetical protein